jgi:membrane protease YdiL (CAAX protease family)
MNETLVPEQPTTYIAAARQGHHTWLRYLIGTILIAVAWFVGGTIATLVVIIGYGVFTGDFGLAFEMASPNPPPDLIVPTFLTLMVSFVPFFLGTVAVVRFLHNRPVRTLVTGKSRINWRRVGTGAGVWVVLLLVTLGIDIVLRPDMYTFQFDITQWLPYTLLALLFIPIQSGTEELVFRGYLMQATSVFTRNPILLMLPSSLLFGALHLANPEVASNFWLLAAYYAMFGLFTAWISLKDGTIELALGMHIANNMTAIISTFPDSALPAPAPILKNVFEPEIDVTLFIVMAVVFYFIVFGRKALSGVPLNPAPPAAPVE